MSFPDLELLLNEWWGGGVQNCGWAAGVSSLAANYIVGGNPLYQISDFLAMYPKFGVGLQAILTAAVGSGGLSYAVNNTVTVNQADASGGVLTVATVNGSGTILTFAAIDGAGVGTGYRAENGLPTSTNGAGVGATVNVVTVSPYSSAVGVPLVVLQAYLSLAAASLQFNRWNDHWRLAMGLYIAHFLTLYLRSEGAIGSTPQQVAASGLEKGIKIAEAAGDVSKSSQLLDGMAEWGAWAETTYGVQLVTWARVIGMPHSVYIR